MVPADGSDDALTIVAVCVRLCGPGKGLEVTAMQRYCFFVLSLLLCAATPALAASHDLGFAMRTTVELPAGWEVDQQFPVHASFRTEDGSCEASLLVKEVALPNAMLLAQGRAADWKAASSLRMLPEGQGFIFSVGGERSWLAEADGWMVEVHASAPHKDLPVLLRGFKANGDVPALARLFALLSTSSAVGKWLGFSDSGSPGVALPLPPASVMPEFVRYGVREGESVAPPELGEKLPAGWSAKPVGPWLVVASNTGKNWAAARYYPLVAEDGNTTEGAPLTHTARYVAALLGGHNLSQEEGVGYFVTPAGFAQIGRRGSRSLVTLFSDNDALQELFGFVQ